MDPSKQMTQEEKLAARKAKKNAKKEQKTAKTTQEPKISTPEKKPEPKISLEAAVAVAVATSETKSEQKAKAEPPKMTEKSREEIEAERKAKKLAKQQGKQQKSAPPASAKPEIDPQEKLMKAILTPKATSTTSLEQKMEKLTLNDEAKPTSSAKTLTKAERRAIQEAQRAAKAQKQQQATQNKSKEGTKVAPTKAKTTEMTSPSEKSPVPITVLKSTKMQLLHKVKLFNHLYTEKCVFDTPVNTDTIHPEIVRLGVQYSNGLIVGANARCIAFLHAMKEMIRDFSTPPQKEFSRELEALIKPAVAYLKLCRPLSVTMTNALRYIKFQLTQLNNDDKDETKRDILLDAIDTYIRDQIEKAAQAISISVQEKIADGDVILTYGCSSLIKHILEAARSRNVDFRVIVVDARPRHEGQEMLKRLIAQGIDCTCVLINAVGFIMPEVTKVLLGAHALLANGYVMSRVGTAQIALIAKSFNVPVLVCCETHKFSERVQTDAFVYNEIGDPEDLVVKEGPVKDPLANWVNVQHLTPLNLCYDVTPPELVTAVVTEVAILPCTSVPVILRIKPSEVGY
ncbi:translation initiation factor eIF2B subunit delta [Culicoides brevitarsis]|uniref:translation initiation factor eIF2B subunit delta n=1 Tax=Culicoides brevitarsis TaxID=469753 RepID=UPI00307CC4C1